MEEKRKNMKAKVICKILKKFLACFILVVIISGYMLPVKRVLAEGMVGPMPDILQQKNLPPKNDFVFITNNRNEVNQVINSLEPIWDEWRDYEPLKFETNNLLYGECNTYVDEHDIVNYYVAYPEKFNNWLGVNQKEVAFYNLSDVSGLFSLKANKINFFKCWFSSQVLLQEYERVEHKIKADEIGMSDPKDESKDSIIYIDCGAGTLDKYGYIYGYNHADNEFLKSDFWNDPKLIDYALPNIETSDGFYAKHGNVVIKIAYRCGTKSGYSEISERFTNGKLGREYKYEDFFIEIPGYMRKPLEERLWCCLFPRYELSQNQQQYSIMPIYYIKEGELEKRYESDEQETYKKKDDNEIQYKPGRTPRYLDDGPNLPGAITVTNPKYNEDNKKNDESVSDSNVTKEQVANIFGKMNDVRLETFYNHIEWKKNGGTDYLTEFMTVNDNYFSEHITQIEFNLLCRYVKEQTGIDYTHTLPPRIIQDENNDEPIGYYECTYLDCKYQDHKIIAGAHYKEYDGYDNYIQDIDGYIQYLGPDGWSDTWFGDAEIPITKNGNYVVLVGFYGSEDWFERFEYNITDIDTELPIIDKVNEINPTSEIPGQTLEISLSDDQGLDKLTVTYNGKEEFKKEINLEGTEATKEVVVPYNGKYTIEVTDKWGKTTTQEETVSVDTVGPKSLGVQSYTISNGENNNVNNGTYEGMPIVKKGDILYVTIKADKEIKSIGSSNYGHAVDPAIRLATENSDYFQQGEEFKVNSEETTINIEITDELLKNLELEGKSGTVGMELNHVKNKYNYEAEKGGFSYDKLFYIDDEAPKLIKAEIYRNNGKGRSYTDENATYNFIENNSKYDIVVSFSEELGETPKIKIGNTDIEVEATYQGSEYINVQEGYMYKVAIDGTQLINTQKLERNSDIPVIISNIKDKVGNVAEDITLDSNNKFSENNILYYGVIEKNKLYIASEESEGLSVSKGDINGDGFVNEYDSFLIERYLYEGESLTETQKQRADINGRDGITQADLLSVRNRIQKAVNYIYPDVEIGFTVYDAKNEKLNPSELVWKINGKLVTNEDVDYHIDSNEVYKIKISESKFNAPIIVEVSKGDDTIGKMTLIDGRKKSVFNIDTNNKDFVDISIRDNKNNTDEEETNAKLGDVNGDGRVTLKDALLIQRYGIGYKDKDFNDKVADINGDGKITVKDASMLQRIIMGLSSSYVRNSSVSTVEKGKTYTLEATKNAKDGNVENGVNTNENIGTIEWNIIADDENVFELINNNDGTAELTVKEKSDILLDTVFFIEVKWKNNENILAENQIELKIIKPEIEGDEKPIILKVGEQCNINMVPKMDGDNLTNETEREGSEKIDVSIENSNVILDDSKNIILTAKAPGDAVLKLKSGDGSQKNVNVKVVRPIESITVDKKELTVKQGEEESLKVTVNPTDTTEELKYETSDKNIVTVRKESTKDGVNVYKIYGNGYGNAQIRFYSENNTEVDEKIEVNVQKQEMPAIRSITIENNENKSSFKAGEEMVIRVNFDGSVRGTVPELNMKFGKYPSKNKAEFINAVEENKVLRYKYVVADGDNGELIVEKLQGGNLKDLSEKVEVATTLKSNMYNLETEETEGTKDYVNDGVYQRVMGAKADTKAPTVKIVSIVDKDSNWLKTGDEIKVQIVADDELKEKPEVTFNGIKATVEGEYRLYTASMKVTENMQDGVIEVKVDNIVDLAGNKKEAVVVKDNGIINPIIIDNSVPIVSSVNIKKKQGEEVKAGESFDIVVNFADTANVTKEYIKASEVPVLKLKIGGKEAKGTITSDYKPGDYVQVIKYTYTVSAEDKGEVTIDGMNGIIEDAAGNTSDLSKMNIKSNVAEAQTDNNPTTPVNISKTTNTTNTTKTPTTGDKIAMSAAILLTVILTAVVVELLYRRNKRDI